MAESDLEAQLVEYRRDLVLREQASQESYDKAVLTLSGGALGLSFSFVRDIVGPGPVASSGFLLAAWSAWAVSIAFVLASFYFGHLALRKAIIQVDSETIHEGKPGGKFDTLTAVLNAAAGVAFLVGVTALTLFVSQNV